MIRHCEKECKLQGKSDRERAEDGVGVFVCIFVRRLTLR